MVVYGPDILWKPFSSIANNQMGFDRISNVVGIGRCFSHWLGGLALMSPWMANNIEWVEGVIGGLLLCLLLCALLYGAWRGLLALWRKI